MIGRRLALSLADPRARILSLIFLAGQLLDSVTTHVALSSGRFREANPVFAPVLGGHELAGLLLKMLAAMLVLSLALTHIARPRRVLVLAILAAISLEAPLTNGLRLLGVM